VTVWGASLAILGWYGRESVGNATRIGLGDQGHKMWVLLRGLRGPGHKVWVLLCGLGGIVVRKSKSPRALQGFGDGFGALGGRGVT
jgi:hypothetical protein